MPNREEFWCAARKAQGAGTYESFAGDIIGRSIVGARAADTKCRGPLRVVVGRALDTELLEPAAQRVGVETQERGRALRPVDHPTCSPEDVQDMVTLDSFECEARAGGGRRDRLAEDVAADLQRAPGREDDGALEDILQLADVAGPGISSQPLHRLLADAVDALADPRGKFIQEESHQERDVLRPLAERGKRDREDTESIVQVLAERLLADGLEQIAVGGGDDPDIDFPRGRPADSVELVFLQDAEQLRLRLEGELADLVEEDRPPIGELKPADSPGDGAGEGPLLMTEKLALDEPGGKCRAVELDQRLIPALAVGVDRPRDQFLARARLAADEHGGVGRCHAAERCRAPPDEPGFGR